MLKLEDDGGTTTLAMFRDVKAVVPAATKLFLKIVLPTADWICETKVLFSEDTVEGSVNPSSCAMKEM